VPACVALVKRSVAENHILTNATHAANILGRIGFGCFQRGVQGISPVSLRDLARQNVIDTRSVAVLYSSQIPVDEQISYM